MDTSPEQDVGVPTAHAALWRKNKMLLYEGVHVIVPTDINKIIMLGPQVEKNARDSYARGLQEDCLVGEVLF